MRRTRAIFLDGFYILFMISALISFRFNAFDSIRSLFWIIAFLLMLPYVKIQNTMDKAVLLYVICGLLSFIGLAIHPYPVEFFTEVFMHSYLPIIFYFYGKACYQQFPKFYEYSLYAYVFCALVGFYLFYTNPGWYVERSLEVLNLHGFYTEDTLAYAKFSSFLDPYHMTNLGMFAVCCSIGYLQNIKESSSKRTLHFFFFVVSFIAVLFTRQRVGMYIGLVYVFFYIFTSSNRRKLAPALIVIALAIVLNFILVFNDSEYNNLILSRFTKQGASSMVSIRSGTWINALLNQRDFIFGHGVGGGGHLASAYGIKPVVVDGSYFKVLLETGLLSTLTLLYILINSLIKSYKIKDLRAEFLIVLFYCFSMIGANVIDFQYVIIPMWYAIGRISAYRGDYMKTEILYQKV